MKCKFSTYITESKNICIKTFNRFTGDGCGTPTKSVWIECEGTEEDKKGCPYWNNPLLLEVLKQ